MTLTNILLVDTERNTWRRPKCCGDFEFNLGYIGIIYAQFELQGLCGARLSACNLLWRLETVTRFRLYNERGIAFWPGGAIRFSLPGATPAVDRFALSVV